MEALICGLGIAVFSLIVVLALLSLAAAIVVAITL